MKLFSRISIAFVVTFLLATALLDDVSFASNWPQWRGPYGQGISEEKNLPTQWSAGKNIKWKTPIPGRGHSSPIVWGNRIFVTTAIEGEAVPGAKAVKHMMGDKEFLHPDSIGADKKHTFKVICLDRKTGKILWDRLRLKELRTTTVIAKAHMPLPRPPPTGNLSSRSSVPRVFMPMT